MKINAPFTVEQARALNAMQREGPIHPYTCGIDSTHPPLWASMMDYGWRCAYPSCDYRQDWALSSSVELGIEIMARRVKEAEERRLATTIRKENMVVGGYYRVQARNFRLGVWSGKGVIGLRTKFGEIYPFQEYHYDDGPPYGTTHVKELLDRAPDEIELKEYLKDEDDKIMANEPLYDWLAAMREKHQQEDE